MSAMEEEEEESPAKPLINLVVIGHVDAGKSTLMGHLLYLLGCVTKREMHKYENESKQRGKASFAFAWVLDAHEEERNRGITVDVGVHHFETSKRRITLLDSPGHRDFIPNMIAGAAQADVALLVVNAVNGEFETGFQDSGQTKEHAILVKSLGVRQILVAVNKMDATGWCKERYFEIEAKVRTFLKTCGYKDKHLCFVPCSGLTGGNLIEPETHHDLSSWYSQKTLIQCIDELKPPPRDLAGSFRFCVSDVYQTHALGTAVSGKVVRGSVQVGDKVMIRPCNVNAVVKALACDGSPRKSAGAGDNVDIGLTGIAHSSFLRVGQILCDVENPIPLVRKFRAQIVSLNIRVPLLKGQDLVLHVHCVDEPAKLIKLRHLVDKRTGEVLKKKPRCVTSNQSCLVDIETERSVCVDTFKESKPFGRFLLRRNGLTVAVGMITKISQTQ